MNSFAGHSKYYNRHFLFVRVLLIQMILVNDKLGRDELLVWGQSIVTG